MDTDLVIFLAQVTVELPPFDLFYEGIIAKGVLI